MVPDGVQRLAGQREQRYVLVRRAAAERKHTDETRHDEGTGSAGVWVRIMGRMIQWRGGTAAASD